MEDGMEFVIKANGPTPREAFRMSQANEFKDDFITVPLPPSDDPYQMAARMISSGDARVSDVEGPAGCVDITSTTHGITTEHEIEDRVFLFFGWMRY